MIQENKTLLSPQPQPDFVETPYVKEISERALAYIRAGFPVHFRGAAGTGKTTMAKHIASLINRPMVLIHGDEEFTTSSLIGGENGFQSRQVIDNFISSVLKKEEKVVKHWVDNRLTVACRHGFTLVYDEYTRSRPEANNILLSILEEKILNLPISRGDDDPYISVHPDFTAIFTSNPEEYVGVYKSQDALLDRMVTIDLDFFDYQTEVSVTQAKAQLAPSIAELIVKIVREVRAAVLMQFAPTVRSCIMIAKALREMEIDPSVNPERFATICQDVLIKEIPPRLSENSLSQSAKMKDQIHQIIRKALQDSGAITLNTSPDQNAGGNGTEASTSVKNFSEIMQVLRDRLGEEADISLSRHRNLQGEETIQINIKAAQLAEVALFPSSNSALNHQDHDALNGQTSSTIKIDTSLAKPSPSSASEDHAEQIATHADTEKNTTEIPSLEIVSESEDDFFDEATRYQIDERRKHFLQQADERIERLRKLSQGLE